VQLPTSLFSPPVHQGVTFSTSSKASISSTDVDPVAICVQLPSERQSCIQVPALHGNPSAGTATASTFPVIAVDAAAGVARVVLGAQDGAQAAAEDFGGSFEIQSRRLLDLGRNASVNVQQGRVETATKPTMTIKIKL
jgi:hypothetical protein